MTLDSAGTKIQAARDLGVRLPGATSCATSCSRALRTPSGRATPTGPHARLRATERARSAARLAPIWSNFSIAARTSRRSPARRPASRRWSGRRRTPALVHFFAQRPFAMVDRILDPVLADSDPSGGFLAHPLAPRRARDELVDPCEGRRSPRPIAERDRRARDHPTRSSPGSDLRASRPLVVR